MLDVKYKIILLAVLFASILVSFFVAIEQRKEETKQWSYPSSFIGTEDRDATLTISDLDLPRLSLKFRIRQSGFEEKFDCASAIAIPFIKDNNYIRFMGCKREKGFAFTSRANVIFE